MLPKLRSRVKIEQSLGSRQVARAGYLRIGSRIKIVANIVVGNIGAARSSSKGEIRVIHSLFILDNFDRSIMSLRHPMHKAAIRIRI